LRRDYGKIEINVLREDRAESGSARNAKIEEAHDDA
jgi:hypothetical protein